MALITLPANWKAVLQAYASNCERMPPATIGEMGVEIRCHRSCKGPSTRGQAEGAVFDRRQAVGIARPEKPRLLDDRAGKPRKCLLNLVEGEGETAHDVGDHFCSQPVVRREAVAANRRHACLLHMAQIFAGRRHVLDITLTELADRRRAETNKCFRGIVGIALEIATKAPFAS